MKKTNAMRILDELGIKYTAHEYDAEQFDNLAAKHLAHGAAGKTASQLHIDAKRVFKTIVMVSEDKEVSVFCQNATSEINLKKAREATGAKSIEPLKEDVLQKTTGYIRGGCSPLGMKRHFATYIDKSALECETIFVSAGVRGLQLEIAPADLVRACNAKVVDLELK